MHQNVVWSHAGLSAVGKPTLSDALCRYLKVGVLIDDGGTLSPELEDAGDEVVGCSLGDQPALLRTAGEDDKVELLGDDRLSYLDLSLDDSKIPAVKVLFKILHQDLGAGRC